MEEKIPDYRDWIYQKDGDLYIYIYDPWEKTYVPYLKGVGILRFDTKTFRYTTIPNKTDKSNYTKVLLKIVKEVRSGKRNVKNVGPEPIKENEIKKKK